MAYGIVAGLVIVCVAVVAEGLAWFAAQMLMMQAEEVAAWFWPMAMGVFAVGAAVLSIPLLLARRHVRLRAVGLAWLVAALATGALGLTRVVPIAAGELGLAVQTAACLVVAGAVWPLLRVPAEPVDDPYRAPPAPAAAWWALCVGGLMIAPWAWAGALGSMWETVAAAAAAVAFGVLCGVVLGDRFWRPFSAVSKTRRILGAGGAVGVALLLLGAGVGGAGVHLLTMLTVPALSFAVAALVRRRTGSGRIVGAAAAPAAFGPLAFADADEFLPLMMGSDFGKWLYTAGAIAIVIGLVAGLFFALTAARISHLSSLAAALTVIVAAVSGGTYVMSQPGFYGERLLVVMAEQADLSTITGDRSQRLAQTHRVLRDTAESTQADLRDELDEAGFDWRPFYLVNAIEVDADLWQRHWLSGRDDVAEVLLSPRNRPIPADNPPVTGDVTVSGDPRPNIEQVGAPEAWEAGYDGKGITIGIADSGVDPTHPAYADRYRGGDDSWADPVRGTTEPVDAHGHGTHALGLALGSEGIGVAPGADWMACSNLPRNAGNPGDYLACLEFMFAPYAVGEDPFDDGDPSRAPHIVTNSWGCPPVEGCDTEVLGPAVSAMATAGIFVVAAAGNTGPACGSAGTPPANYRDTFTVGAVDEEGTVTFFSSRGPVSDGSAKPDLVAPGAGGGGSGVVSAVPDGGYATMMGTSMAAPHVAGAVAVLWEARPELVGDVTGTAELLRETASPVTQASGQALDACDGAENTAGAGLLDVAAAVRAG